MNMNPYSIQAQTMSVIIVAKALADRGGWTFNTYDSNLPESPFNKPNGPWEEMNNPFGAEVHTVTFFNDQGVHETVIAGLLMMYPEISWVELERKLGRKQIPAAASVAITAPASVIVGGAR